MVTLCLSSIRHTYNLNVTGNPIASQTLVLAIGFGSDQTTWRHQVAALGTDYRLVLFDYLGCGLPASQAVVHPECRRALSTLERTG